MVLVDTSVWVSHFRESNLHLEQLLHEMEVMSHPFIIGELACGNLKNRSEILLLLESLPRAPLVDHAELLYFVEKHSLSGKGIGFVDASLLASAQLVNARLWTVDLPLKRAAEKLKLIYTQE